MKKKYAQEELNIIIKNHQHWLRKDCKNWEYMKADLECADLSYADLQCANLSYVNLQGADLRGAKLSYTNLRDVDLRCANLSYANLQGTDLRCSNLNYANLQGVNLSYANLSYTILKGANLECAKLNYANLRCANLRDADFHHAILTNADLRDAVLNYTKNMPFIPYTCPDTGSFIGYKKANGLIVELEIPSDARRCSATGRKCRCDKAKVLSIQKCDKNIPCDVTEVASGYDKNFIYRIGEIVEEPEFDENRWNECTKGIHFFINRQEAVRY